MITRSQSVSGSVALSVQLSVGFAQITLLYYTPLPPTGAHAHTRGPTSLLEAETGTLIVFCKHVLIFPFFFFPQNKRQMHQNDYPEANFRTDPHKLSTNCFMTNIFSWWSVRRHDCRLPLPVNCFGMAVIIGSAPRKRGWSGEGTGGRLEKMPMCFIVLKSSDRQTRTHTHLLSAARQMRARN